MGREALGLKQQSQELERWFRCEERAWAALAEGLSSHIIYCLYWEDALLTLMKRLDCSQGLEGKAAAEKVHRPEFRSPRRLKGWVWPAYVCHPKPLMVRREAMTRGGGKTVSNKVEGKD